MDKDDPIKPVKPKGGASTQDQHSPTPPPTPTPTPTPPLPSDG